MKNEKQQETKKETFIPFYDEVIKMDLTFSSKLLYCLILSLSKNNDKVCTASNKYLMERCNFSKKTLERSLEELDENNLFSKRNLIFKKIDDKRKRLQKREIAVKQFGQTDSIKSDINNEFRQNDGANLDNLTVYIGQNDGDLYNKIYNKEYNNINNNSENLKEEDMKLEKYEIEEYIEKGVDIIISQERRLTLEDYESIINSNVEEDYKKRNRINSTLNINSSSAWNLIKNEKGVELKYLKENYWKLYNIEKEIEKWSKSKYEQYIKQKNEKKKNIYWINSKNILIEDLNNKLRTFHTNILNKEASKKTECRYSTSTIESKILNEEKEIKENNILLSESEIDTELAVILTNIKNRLISKCKESSNDSKKDSKKIDSDKLISEIKLNPIFDKRNLKNIFVDILKIKDEWKKSRELIKFEVDLFDEMFDYGISHLEAFKPVLV